jgi:hypothetical protein
MGLKGAVKRLLVGDPGERPRDIGRGLLRGLRFNVDTATKSMRLLGLDEREITSAVQDAAAPPAAAALDVGANDGWYALYFASRPNIERVWAFEPDPNVVGRMHANFALNSPEYLAKLNVDEKFVGDRDDAQYCRVDTVVGDYAKPLVLKIDVDGGELDVLHGAQRTLERNQCTLVIETHSAQLERDCVAFLERLGYRTRIIKNGWYRGVIPEGRVIPFNRWFSARR